MIIKKEFKYWIKTLLKKTCLFRCKMKPFNIKNAKIVILGTFPSYESLKHKKYYSNTKNQFWNLVGVPFGNFDELKKKGIGLWDVIKCCDRETSADKKIKNEVYNNLSVLNGKTIYFNGQTAYDYYIKAKKENPKYANWPTVDKNKNILKSSSAVFAMKFEDKQKDWHKKLGIK